MEQNPFFVHFEDRTLKITQISANADPREGENVILIGYEMGLKFILGQENPANWQIDFGADRHYTIKPIERNTKTARIDIGLGIYECLPNQADDIQVVIDVENNCVEIHYDGDCIKQVTKPVKIYFTREGDMTYLKCAFSLDVNILDSIMIDNGLSGWPNPIRLKLDDVDDISVYAVKGQLSVSIKQCPNTQLTNSTSSISRTTNRKKKSSGQRSRTSVPGPSELTE